MGEWLSALADREVSPRRERQVRAHLATCSRCAALYRELSETRELVQTRLRRRPLPSGFEARVTKALDGVDRQRRTTIPQRRALPQRPAGWPRLALAGALAAVLVSFGAAYLLLFRPEVVLSPTRLAQIHQYHLHAPPEEPVRADSPTRLATALTDRLGYPVTLTNYCSGLSLESGGVCQCLNGHEAALLLCRHPQGSRVSLLQVRARTKLDHLDPTSPGSSLWQGHDHEVNAVVWRTGPVYTAAVSSLPPEKLYPLAGSNCLGGGACVGMPSPR